MPTRIKKSKPLVIIQWSCDPLPYDDIKDTIYTKRVEIDTHGLVNAEYFWRYMKRKSNRVIIPKKKKK